MQKLDFSKAETVMFINQNEDYAQIYTRDKQLLYQLNYIFHAKLEAFNGHEATYQIPKSLVMNVFK